MAEENIGEFGIWLAKHQSLLLQIYGILNIHLPLLGHSLNFSPPKSLNG